MAVPRSLARKVERAVEAPIEELVTRHRALDTLKHTTLLALTSFAQTILPNPLVREMTALAKQAEVDIPFVEEVAADIFMGTFTIKWREAAALTARVMTDTLYARYYDLPAATTWEAPDEDGGVIDRVGARWGKRTAEDFSQICAQRSREASTGDGSRVARNGTVIEQSQILTSHNLAPLVDRLSLADGLRPRASELAVDVFDWIVRQQNTRFDSWHARLQMLKNTAYAWRQAIFFLRSQTHLPKTLPSTPSAHPWRPGPTTGSVASIPSCRV